MSPRRDRGRVRDAGVSLADALLALAILVLAFSMAIRPIATTISRLGTIRAVAAETMRIRQLALESTGAQ